MWPLLPAEGGPREHRELKLVVQGLSKAAVKAARSARKHAQQAHAAWQQQVAECAATLLDLSQAQLEEQLEAVYASYCDRKLFVDTGQQLMDVHGWLRLLHDCDLLDSRTNPMDADRLLQRHACLATTTDKNTK
ncbi:uncharacterized protein HaLaN_14458, partial [Haematococcus lacustris]